MENATMNGFTCEDCKELATPAMPCSCGGDELSDEYLEMLDLMHS